MPTLLNTIGRMLNGFSLGEPLGKLAIAVGSLVTAFYAPIAPLLVSCFAFTVADMFYGLKVAKVKKCKITSERTWKGTITKLLDEFTIISLARMLEYAVLDSTDPFVLTGGTTIIIGLTEMWSILENLNTLNPKGPWKALGKFLKKKGEDYTGTKIEINNDDDD